MKIGDKVKILSGATLGHAVGDIVEIIQITNWLPHPIKVSKNGTTGVYRETELKLVESKEKPTMTRRTFRLIKNIPDFDKGLIVQENCDDGTQYYVSLNGDDKVSVDDFKKYFPKGNVHFSRKTVETQPDWFEELFKPEGMEWLTAEELKQWNEFKSGKKAAPKKTAVSSQVDDMPSKYEWLHKMKKGETKYFNTEEYGRTCASAVYHAKKFSKKFTFTKIDNITSKVKRVK